MNIQERFAGCILGGAIGDALGSGYENQPTPTPNISVFYPFGKPLEAAKPAWRITDDTQLTLATCEAMIENPAVSPQFIAHKFVQLYNARQLTGLGASTLKALQELAIGAHWSQLGRRGEYAAGNGAAMRIAPLAFACPSVTRQLVEQVSKITHHNDEAYAGALSVVISLQAIITQTWTGEENVFEIITSQLPDTRIKDRLLKISQLPRQATIQGVGKHYGSSGYVVESLPLALFAASKVGEIGFGQMLEELVACGGDTDTNCSIAGQIAGALIGKDSIDVPLGQELKALREYDWIIDTIDRFIQYNHWA
jgi:ADP-ribosylglycohydrolase